MIIILTRNGSSHQRRSTSIFPAARWLTGWQSSDDDATVDASRLVQNLLNSLQDAAGEGYNSQSPEKLFTALPDLLPPSTTIPTVMAADGSTVDHLLSFLPPILLLLAQEADDPSSADPGPETTHAALETLSLDQKKEILARVLHSPQFHQSLGSLTVALRDGGLPSISEALGIPVRNGGFMRRGAMPLGGGEAVEAFVEGVKRRVEEEEDKQRVDDVQMDTRP